MMSLTLLKKGNKKKIKKKRIISSYIFIIKLSYNNTIHCHNF